MAEKEVKVRVTTDASGMAAGVNQVNTHLRNMESTAGGVIAKIKAHWLGLSAAIYGAQAVIRKGWNLAEQAAQFEQSKNAFKSMATSMGADAEKLYATLREKSAGLIDEKSLTESANRAMSLGIPVEKLGDLMEIARAKARDMGISASQAFNDIATGVGRASPKILDNLGLMLKVGAANEKMAESLGKTVEQLTDKEKNMALLNATLEAGKEALERYDLTQLTTKEKMEKLTATIKTLQLYMGQGLIRAAAGAVGAFQAIGAGSLKASEYLYKANAAFYKFQAATSIREGSKEYYEKKAAEWAEYAKLDAAEAAKYWADAKDNFSALVASADELDKAMGGNKPPGPAPPPKNELAEVIEAYKIARAETLKLAQEAEKSYKTQLKAAEDYYGKLEEMIAKNIEAERKSLDQLRSLRQQRAGIDKSTADLIAGISGADKSLSAKEQYEKGRSALNQQFMGALNLGGQERVQALEEYKQAVASLQSQFAQGIPGVKNLFGGEPDEILKAKTIAEEAISDIERAAQLQRTALIELEAEKQSQMETERLWGQTLADQANLALGNIENIKASLADLSAQILALPTDVQFTGEDKISMVVDKIIDRIRMMHALASQPVNIGGGSGPSTGASLNLNAGLDFGNAPSVPEYATGISYVPRTGIAKIHRGETVLNEEEARQYRGGKGSVTIGDIVINVPANAAPQRPEDWRSITRNYIMPELKKLSA